MLRSLWFSISGGLGWILTLADICFYMWPYSPQSNHLHRGGLGPDPLDAGGRQIHLRPSPSLHPSLQTVTGFSCASAPNRVLFGGYLGYFNFNNFHAGRVCFSLSSWKQKTGMTLKAPAPLPRRAGQPLPTAFLPRKPARGQLFRALLFKSQPPL